MNQNPLVRVINGHAVTTSIRIAEVFEKRHDNIMRDIRNLRCTQNFRLLNFEEAERTWVNNLGKEVKDRMFNITRDGFTLLAMGFTGEKAMEFKEAYIAKFNEMERNLMSKRSEALSECVRDEIAGALSSFQEEIMLSPAIPARAKTLMYQRLHEMKQNVMTPPAKKRLSNAEVYAVCEQIKPEERAEKPEPDFSLKFKMHYKTKAVMPTNTLAKRLRIKPHDLSTALHNHVKLFTGRAAVFRRVPVTPELLAEAEAVKYDLAKGGGTVNLYTRTGARIMAVLFGRIKGRNRSKQIDKQTILDGGEDLGFDSSPEEELLPEENAQ